MSELEVSNQLKGDYGEIVFEHFCIKNKHAYISLEEIYNNLTPKNILTFKYGYCRVEVKLPEEIIEEVRRICKPSNELEHQPSFVYDYLSVPLYDFEFKDGRYVQKSSLSQSSFKWVEIKTGRSQLSDNQERTKKSLKLRLCVFRIHTEMQDKITIDWEQ